MTKPGITAPADTLRARRELEGGPSRLREKVTTASEAVAAHVRDGDVVAVGGTNHARTPMALLWEVLRQGRTGLALSRPLTCFECELFLATGAADRVITSWVGIGHGWGLARVLREYVEEGRATFEEWSHLGLGLRYKAGAMGMPFLPTLSMLGSDLADRLAVKMTTCPYTGQTVHAVPSLNPDVALIHVQQADRYGNAVIEGYQLMDADVAPAARRVILSAEEIVSTDQLRRDPSRTVIPGFAVDAVVEQRFGAYPHECYGRYDTDKGAFSAYMERVRQEGSEGARAYVREVLAHGDFDSYLEAVGADRLAELSRVEGLMPQ